MVNISTCFWGRPSGCSVSTFQLLHCKGICKQQNTFSDWQKFQIGNIVDASSWTFLPGLTLEFWAEWRRPTPCSCPWSLPSCSGPPADPGCDWWMWVLLICRPWTLVSVDAIGGCFIGLTLIRRLEKNCLTKVVTINVWENISQLLNAVKTSWNHHEKNWPRSLGSIQLTLLSPFVQFRPS